MKYWEPAKGILYNGEALEVLKTLPDESVNCVITSPPYWGLRDYGTAEWEGGDKNCNHFRDSKHSDKCNTGHKNKELVVGDAIYKDVCKKCGAKRIDKQLGLEKTFQEYIIKLCNIFDEVKRILKKDGTVWVVIGDTYSGSMCGSNDYTSSERGKSENYKKMYRGQKPGKTYLPDKCLCLIPERFAIEMCNRGWILRNKNIWHKANCMPSSVKDRFTVDYEEVFFFVKSKKYWFQQQFENQLQSSIDRTDYHFGGRPGHVYPNEKRQNPYPEKWKPNLNGRNKRSVWQINPHPFPEAHFAVFPEELVETPMKAGCPKDGVVMDPFIGSGTVGVVAKKLNLKWIGNDLRKEFCKMSQRRIEKTSCQFDLFEASV